VDVDDPRRRIGRKQIPYFALGNPFRIQGQNPSPDVGRKRVHPSNRIQFIRLIALFCSPNGSMRCAAAYEQAGTQERKNRG
jgi:hypothetical protein